MLGRSNISFVPLPRCEKWECGSCIGGGAAPEPGPGEIRVAVGATALNPIDLYLRAGIVAMPIPLPSHLR